MVFVREIGLPSEEQRGCDPHCDWQPRCEGYLSLLSIGRAAAAGVDRETSGPTNGP